MTHSIKAKVAIYAQVHLIERKATELVEGGLHTVEDCEIVLTPSLLPSAEWTL